MRQHLLIIAASLLVVTLIGGSTGTLGGSDSSPLSIDFEEAKYNPEEVYTIPGFTASTHTAAVNNGSIDAYVFMKVDVPVVKASDIDLAEEVHIRSDGYVPVMEFEPQAPWLLVEEDITDGVLQQIYCYGELIPLKPGETTPKLFDTWSVVNCHVVNGMSGSMQWSTIASLCPETRISISSIQTNIGSDLTPKLVWTMLK